MGNVGAAETAEGKGRGQMTMALAAGANDGSIAGACPAGAQAGSGIALV